MAKSIDDNDKWGVDHAITRDTAYGLRLENTYSGVLSYLRTKYAKDLSEADVAVTGIPYDLAVTNRPGTRFGPRTVRAASAQLAWGPLWPWDHDPLKRLAVVDYGDCEIDHGNPHEIPQQIESHIDGILETGTSSVSIGGDHFISLPIMKAYAKRHGPLAMIHFDAHSDTWIDDADGRIDHGCMFYHAAREGIVDAAKSVQIGLRTHNKDDWGFTRLSAPWVHANGIDAVIESVRSVVGETQCYLTFDIDCLDPAFAPGTGTPVIGGLNTHQAQAILRGLAGLNVVGMDIMEVAPAYDVGEITALAGASLALEMLYLYAARPASSARG